MSVKGQEASAGPATPHLDRNVYTEQSWKPERTCSVCTDQIKPADQFHSSPFFHGQADVGENSQNTVQESVNLLRSSFLGKPYSRVCWDYGLCHDDVPALPHAGLWVPTSSS